MDERVSRAAALSAIGVQPVASLPLSNLLDPQPRHRTRWPGATASMLVDFGTDTAIEAVALLSTTLGAADTVRWRLGALEGLVEAVPVFDLRFTSPGTLTYPAGWAFNRTTAGWCFDATGTLVQVPADTPRFDYDPATLACRGLLLEEARTNHVRNPRAEGATPGTIGSGGNPPTFWEVSVPAGFTAQIVGSGTETGIPYCDIRLSGTGAGLADLSCEPWGTGPVAGDSWNYTVFVRLSGGSLAGVAAITTRIYYNGGAGNTLGSVTPTSAPLREQRWTTVPTIAGVGVDNVKGSLRIDLNGTVDITLRVGAAQLEKGGTPSSVILPPAGAPAVSTRAADRSRITGLSIGAASLLVQCQAQASTSGNVVPAGFGPDNSFSNSSYFTIDATGFCGWTMLSGGTGYGPSGISGTVNSPVTLVGAAGATGSSFARNGAQRLSTTPFLTPTGMDRVTIGGAPWGGASVVGTATGIGTYQRLALYGTRLLDTQAASLGATGSSLVAAAVAHDSGALAAATDAAFQGNVVLLRSSAATGRYLLVDIAAPGAAVIDIGRIVAGPLWRVSRAVAYGVQEGREVLDRRDRNPLTGAEFPVPALARPRLTRFTLPLLTAAEVRTQHRALLGALGGFGEALWIPETTLPLAELNARSIWGAVAAPGEEALAIRDSPTGTSRSFRIVERL